MTQAIHHHQFDNGLILLGESMAWLESAAFAIQLPAGHALDPVNRLGTANFACDMVQRGCGPRDSRQFVEDLDRLGTDRSASVSAVHTSFGATMLADNLESALRIYADLVRQPHLPENQIEDGRMVCLQEVAAAEDDLVHRTMVRLRHRHYGAPWGRTPHGTFESVEQITLDDVARHVSSNFHPNGTILSVAGKIDWDQLVNVVGDLFSDWQPQSEPPLRTSNAEGGYEFIPYESNQTQIGVAFPCVPYSHPDYFQARGAVGILSDGMSSRLFTEVREKRGLCYTVHASCHSLREQGSVLCYAATSTENSQQTLDVLLAELMRLPQGVEPTELDRLKARIKSSLILQQESSASRCLAMAGDWYHLGRILNPEELSRIIDGLSCESINAFLAANPPQTFTVVTLGEKELEVAHGTS